MQFSTYTILWHHGIAANSDVALSRSRLLRFFVRPIDTNHRSKLSHFETLGRFSGRTNIAALR